MRRAALALAAVTTLAWLSACAGTASTNRKSTGDRPFVGDVDGEEDRHGRDVDDNEVFGFGRPARNVDARAIAALVKRYYAAGIAHNGATACSLLYSAMAESVAEDYSRVLFGSDSARGDTCAAVMSRFFERRHRQLARDSDVLHVTQVRTKGNQGLALLALGTKPERHILLRREFGVWKVDTLLDIGMP